MHRLIILLCAVLTGCPVPVRAQDYTKAVDAAWCTGVLASAIEAPAQAAPRLTSK
jgi:hypothetical protein